MRWRRRATGIGMGNYPLTSRFDENDAIFVFDKRVQSPGKTCSSNRDIEKLKQFYPRSGLRQRLSTMQGCTRLAVKLDFHRGLPLQGGARSTGPVEAFRGGAGADRRGWDRLAQPILGPSPTRMACNPDKWVGDARAAERSGRPWPTGCSPPRPIRRSVPSSKRVIASGLIYLPSHAPRLQESGHRQISAALCCAAPTASTTNSAIKVMKLLWDAVGTEFGRAP